MDTGLRMTRSAFLVLLLSLRALPAAGQSISLKTVPIATGEQFLIFPSRSLGMGGLSVAYDDPLAGPFGNPARGALVQGTWMMASPVTYGATVEDVGGHTLPLAVTHGGVRWFGAAAAAVQQLEAPEQRQWWGMSDATDNLLLDDEASNSYLFGALGRKLGDGKTSVGVAAYYADLRAVDGVGQLYGNSVSIRQSGTLRDIRVGALHELGAERRLELMAGNSLLDMEHDVLYVTWPPQTDPWTPTPWTPSFRTEHEVDRTSTWSGSVRYTAPLEETSRIGVLFVANTKSHPKIPNYEIVNIPRDPGNSTLFALGVGLTSSHDGGTFGAELLLQPGRSHTWAFADSAITTPRGTLHAGDKTVDNQFRFANWSLAIGWDKEWRTAGMQLGLRMNRYGYALEQENFLAGTYRETDESWMEWSPSWGGMLKAGRVELRYSGRFVAKGFDELGFFGGSTRDVIMAPEAPGGTDYLVAPTSPVSMPDFRVTTHQLMIVVPLSRER